MKFLKDDDFKNWLEENEIIYKEKDEEYIAALYSEFLIEMKTKK